MNRKKALIIGTTLLLAVAAPLTALGLKRFRSTTPKASSKYSDPELRRWPKTDRGVTVDVRGDTAYVSGTVAQRTQITVNSEAEFRIYPGAQPNYDGVYAIGPVVQWWVGPGTFEKAAVVGCEKAVQVDIEFPIPWGPKGYSGDCPPPDVPPIPPVVPPAENCTDWGNPALGLTPDSGTYQDAFEVALVLNAGTQSVSSVAVVLDWNPLDLSTATSKIKASKDFAVEDVSVDTTAGTIQFTVGKADDQEITGKGIELARVTFGKKRNVKETKIEFVTGETQPAKTRVYANGEDVLCLTSGATFKLTSVEETTTPPTEPEEPAKAPQKALPVTGGGPESTAPGAISVGTGKDVLTFLVTLGFGLITTGFLWVAIP